MKGLLEAIVAAGTGMAANGRGGYEVDGKTVDRGHAFALIAAGWVEWNSFCFLPSVAGLAKIQDAGKVAA